MKEQKITLKSNYDGLILQGVIFEPDEKAKGVVQIQHGMAEFKERYAEFMRFLVSNGYVAVCFDQRGHGDSVVSEEDWGWFHDFDGVAFVEDAVQVTKEMRRLYPNLPITLLGHSMGSMIVRCYIRENDDLIDKLIISGSPSKNPLAGTAIALTKIIRLFKGERHRSKLLSFLSTGKGDKYFKGEPKGAWLSRNYECTKSFHANPKGGFTFTCNGFENLFNLMKRTYRKKGYQVKNPDLPIKFLSGEKDPVLIKSGKFGQTIDFLYSVKGEKGGYKNITGKLYKEFRHEILNEIGREEVYADVLEFLNA